MKLTIDAKILSAAVEAASKAVPSRSPLPILSHLLLRVRDGQFTLTATDLRQSLQVGLPAPLASDGACCVPAAPLRELLGSLRGDVTLSVDGARLLIVGVGSKFDLATISADEYPIVTRPEGAPAMILPAADLAALIHSGGSATASGEETRDLLFGALLTVGDGRVDMVSTDGRRLTQAWVTHSDIRPKPGQWVVHRDALQTIASICSRGGQASIYVSEVLLWVEVGETVIGSRRMDGTFPHFQKLIPTGPMVTWPVVDRNALTAALKRILVLSHDKNFPDLISLEVRSGEIILRSRTPDLGDGWETVPAFVEEGAERIGLNGRIFLAALSSARSETVRLEIRGAETGIILRPGETQEESGWEGLVMPVRIPGAVSEGVAA